MLSGVWRAWCGVQAFTDGLCIIGWLFRRASSSVHVTLMSGIIIASRPLLYSLVPMSSPPRPDILAFTPYSQNTLDPTLSLSPAPSPRDSAESAIGRIRGLMHTEPTVRAAILIPRLYLHRNMRRPAIKPLVIFSIKTIQRQNTSACGRP
jgi:hypothetical protein